MKICSVILLIFFCLNGVSAQSAKRETNLRSLVEAEMEFSRTSAARGMREAFLQFLADDGVIFPQGVPSNGKDVWRAREDAAGLLTWMPIFADVSNAGDLGYTSGPYEFRKAANEAPIGYGYYVSVWRRGSDAVWKVALDIGTRNQRPVETPALELASDAARKQFDKFNSGRERSKLLDVDRKFSEHFSTQKPSSQLLNHVSERIRVHRMNRFPRLGRDAMLDELRMLRGKLLTQPMSGEIASSGDLGYTFGTYKLAAEQSNGETDGVSESGSYLRIWKRKNDGRWKLVLDLLHPVHQRRTQ